MNEPPESLRPTAKSAGENDGASFGPREMPEIDAANLLKLAKSLERYAAYLLKRAPLKSSSGRIAPADLASAAIVCAIENLRGQVVGRRWDPEKCSLGTFCRGHVRGEIINTRTRAEEVHTDDINGEAEMLVDADERWNPHSIYVLKEKYLKLREVMKGDWFALRVLDLMLESEEYTVAQTAINLHSSTSEIKNARRRIYRHAQEIGRG